MLISSTREPFDTIKKFIGEAKREVVLLVPYVKVGVVEDLICETSAKIVLITTWKLQDLWQGSSDIKLYPFTKSKSIKLFINNRIHLKVYMTDWARCILGSSNVSKRGLGISESYNYELNAIHQEMDTDTLLYLRRVLAESTLVDDRIYQSYIQKLAELPEPPKMPEPVDILELRNNQLTVSSLPMSHDIFTLYEIYSNDFVNDDTEAVQCAMHDVANYNVPLDLSYEELFNHLKEAFFKSAFIVALLEKIDDDPIFFGETKAWIQSNCVDVPVPSRRDLTGNVQVLYRWIVELGQGRYAVDRPNYSERLFSLTNV